MCLIVFMYYQKDFPDMNQHYQMLSARVSFDPALDLKMLHCLIQE